MDSTILLIGVLNIIGGIVFIALAIPMLRGSVKMNYFYGARFAESFESEEGWKAINKNSARWLIGCGAALMIAGFITLVFAPEEGSLLFWLMSFASAIAALVALVGSYLYAKDYSARRNGRDSFRE